jgi:hypothetical protein
MSRIWFHPSHASSRVQFQPMYLLHPVFGSSESQTFLKLSTKICLTFLMEGLTILWFNILR